jgi:signal transduction histidine kinase
MLSRWPIRYKLTFALLLLLLTVLTLAVSGFQGAYAYRGLVKSISRTTELPLLQQVTDLRVTLSQARPIREFTPETFEQPVEAHLIREQFRAQFQAVQETLANYETQLAGRQLAGQTVGDYQRERATVGKLKQTLRLIEELNQHEDWVLDEASARGLDEKLADLQRYSGELTAYLRERLNHFAEEVRTKYRVWIGITWATSITAGLMLAAQLVFFWKWIFAPLQVVIRGSRQVADGQFDHRIRLSSRDEMAELANALNEMTERFQAIRDDLDEQVKQRTREVVRSERMASVGFLAAGVAHEINNPLASVALCAESLSERVDEVLPPESEVDEKTRNGIAVTKKYLGMIEKEAFRCKDITERLLDFSRMGDVEKQDTDLAELVQGVIDMVQHLGKYRDKHVGFEIDRRVVAPVCAQEIKQVVLNLITNALDALDPGGRVHVRVGVCDDDAELIVDDDGCGMTEEVIEHLFEPFFTRRRDKQGTGLGLSITYRIIRDHGGQIDATSEGPGHGSRFRVTLPLKQHEQERQISGDAA